MPQPSHYMFPNSNMLNQSAVDALYSATYLEDYLDSVESLPDDLQQHFTRLREIDLVMQSYFREISGSMKRFLELGKNGDANQLEVSRLQSRVQALLISCQELGDEKIHVGQEIHETIENKTRQLELDRKNLDSVHRSPSRQEHQSSMQQKDDRKRVRRIRHETYIPSILGPATLTPTLYNADGKCAQPSVTEMASQATLKNSAISIHKNYQSEDERNFQTYSTSGTNPSVSQSGSSQSAKDKTDQYAATSSTTPYTTKMPEKRSAVESKTAQQLKRSRKRRQSFNKPENTVPIPTDPDEPTYCHCDQVSYGEMILCENDLCPIEWFHFSCVNLSTKPKGKWYCPKCRGDRPNQMKPRSIFLKELESYNKEKEART